MGFRCSADKLKRSNSGNILVGSKEMTDNNFLFYGDNLEVLRKHIKDETVDLCYIDPPFNSKRNYNQIYNNIGTEDSALAQAFTDTWVWDDIAIAGYNEIISNEHGRFTPKTVELVKGLRAVLQEGSLLAYIISLTLRVTEIHRILKKTGSFYFHCDPTASHYIKIMLDGIFCAQGGEYQNEISWKRSSAHSDTKQGMKRCGRIRDVLLFYTKSDTYTWNPLYTPYTKDYLENEYRHIAPDGRRYKETDLTAAKPGGDVEYEWRVKRIGDSRWVADLSEEYKKPKAGWEYKGVPPYNGRYWAYSKANLREFAETNHLIHRSTGMPRLMQYADEMPGISLQDNWDDINLVFGDEDLGYPTQKPIGLLERIIQASSNPGNVVLDAYCGCGTTIDAAQKWNRKWIGIDITYQSIAVILKRLEDIYNTADQKITDTIILSGIPKDLKSAIALANKKDDRLRKEFEKWAVLTYTNNRAVINDKRGADGGIDGRAYFKVGKKDNAKIIFQVKSGNTNRGDIAKLRGDMDKDKAELAVLITLEEPTKPMLTDAKTAGVFNHIEMGKSYDRISIITIKEMLEKGKRLEIPMSLEVLKAAEKAINEEQLSLL